MLVERAARVERVVDPVAERVAQLVLVHPAVQAERGDDVHVVDAGVGGEIEHCFDDALAVVGRAHLRQRQADIVERDRQLHPREQLRRQRILVVRVQQRVADRAVDVVDRVERLGRIDHAAATGGQLLEAEVLAAPEHDRGSGAIHFEDESGARHQVPLSLMSKATFTAPRRPAEAA